MSSATESVLLSSTTEVVLTTSATEGVLATSPTEGEISELGVTSFREASLFACGLMWAASISLVSGEIIDERSSGGGDGGADECGESESICATSGLLLRG